MNATLLPFLRSQASAVPASASRKSFNFKLAISIASAGIALAGISQAALITDVVTFDPPGFAKGPSIYVAVPGPQTIVTTPATFSGGVVLGFATFFPAISFATVPNVYGSADFGNGLSSALTISIDPAFTTSEVSFALFNGETFNQSYTVNAFNGTSLVASQTLTNVAPNFNSGFGLIDLNSFSGITGVTIAPTGSPAAWDFLIDTVAFNQNIASVPNTPPPPIIDPVTLLPVIKPPTPPVHGHIHGHGKGEVELVEVNFGDDITDIKGSVFLVTPSNPPPGPATTPEPATCMMVVAGLVGLVAHRRRLLS